MSMLTSLTNKIIKVTTKNFKVLAITIGIIVAIICYFFLVSPKISDLQSFQLSSYQEKQQELEERQQYLADLKIMKEKYLSWRDPDIEKINQILPVTDDYPGIFSQVEELVSEAGYNLSDLTISRGPEVQASGNSAQYVATPGGAKVLNLQMSVGAPEDFGYDNYKTLLRTLENNLRLMDVISVSFGPGQNSFRLNFRTYYLPS